MYSGAQLFLIDGNTGNVLQSLVVGAQTPAATLTATPNPIQVPFTTTAGVTTLSYNAPGHNLVDIRVSSPTGGLLSRQGSSGSATTGQWVPNNTNFYLVDTNTGATLQSLTVNMQNNAVQGTVTVANLTHPSWGNNFNVGDTLQATVTGAMPYQPVSIDWSSSSKALLGQTDSTGKFVWNYVTKSTDVNSYTEVWDVGGVTVTPALTFLIGQLGGTGTISTTNMGQTPSGHVTGVSTLSITNGVVSTYSATELDYYASLYYDSGSVATLFDNGTQVKQFVTPAANGTTTASTNRECHGLG